MPELPEVETIRTGLQQELPGRKILKVWTDTPKLLSPELAEFEKKVIDQRIVRIDRRAKLIFIWLENGLAINAHLKLTGRLLVREKGDPPDEWQHVVLTLSGQKELRFCDLRKFGWLRVLTKDQIGAELAKYGPEPLDDLTLVLFNQALASTRRAVKTVLLDQTKFAGIGNIYANDALFLAKINPSRPANDLSVQEGARLFEALETVLKAGLKYRGASDNHYLDAFGKKGQYQNHFLVYGRTNQPCPNCQGKIERKMIGGRGTFWCSACQK